MRTVRSQIMLLFALLMIAFVTLGFAWSQWERTRAATMALASYRDKQQIINNLFELSGASIKSMAEDYTSWDDLAKFVSTRDTKWAEQNLVQSLSTYKASSLWVYDARGKQIYAAASELHALPLSDIGSRARSELAATQFCHFFENTPAGLIEIRGANIHSSSDSTRTGHIFGTLFVGKLRDSVNLHDLRDLTGCSVIVRIYGRDRMEPFGIRSNASYTHSIQLADSNGHPVASMQFIGTLHALALFHESARWSLALFIGFAVFVISILFVALHFGVNSPLNRLCASLRAHDTSVLQGMVGGRTEYGEIARLIESFFAQQQVLQGEVAERAHAEEALLKAHRELEVRVQERTSELEAAYGALKAEYAERRQAEEELSRAEAQLVQSAKLAALGTLCAGVAHELNQPIAVIRGLSQQLLHEIEATADTYSDLQLIEGQTTRMMKIVGHLRTFSRASRGDAESVDVHRVISDCFIIIGQQLKAHNVAVSLELDSAPAWVLGDTNELEQVFINLISNARDALEGVQDASIVITSRRVDGSIVLQFRDNGGGIADEAITRLFDPFFTTKEPGKGTGLGLSISHTIIEKHGGTIRAFNDSGATFEIVLPLAVDAAVGEADSSVPKAA